MHYSMRWSSCIVHLNADQGDHEVLTYQPPWRGFTHVSCQCEICGGHLFDLWGIQKLIEERYNLSVAI